MTDVPASCQTFLAFDYGLKRTGVASGNRLTRTATPQAMASIKSLCRNAYFQTLEEQLEQEAHSMVLSQESDESQEGIGAFLEKRQVDFVKLRRP